MINTGWWSLHNHVVEDGLRSPRPFQEVVELGLYAAVARVTSRGAVTERFAEKRHPRRRQPAAAHAAPVLVARAATALDSAAAAATRTVTVCYQNTIRKNMLQESVDRYKLGRADLRFVDVRGRALGSDGQQQRCI